MDKALDGLRPPSEDITEAVLAQASRRQNRRRAGALLATSAGLALVAGLVVALPHTANGAAGAAKKPGPVSATTHAAAPKPLRDPAALVQSLLPPGTGTVTKIKDLPPTSPPPGAPRTTVFPKSRLDGTYLVTKDGKVAALIVQTYDPKAVPAQWRMTASPANVCNEIPASWDCKESVLPDGVQLVQTTEPPGNWGEHAGTVGNVSVAYPDGRVVSVDALAETHGLRPTNFGPGWANPPLDRAELAAFAESPAWFS
ncbi:hypothetical protein DN069_22340 [Streptacidiphilus pinicola]|uniref:Uncharacterized protein n=2 Tax=Streptacidiphilus pinicola TaxID=2219663 RepID=A0A2X0IJ78_9ACTN|nr:hypothetical protein DN069_22340 [Streptacidiphilus pinicola]